MKFYSPIGSILKSLVIVAFSGSLCTFSLHASKELFWLQQRKGANFFHEKPYKVYFENAQHVGIEFTRLTPSKWKPSDKDFLVGNCKRFTNISDEDFALLVRVLDYAAQCNIKVVLTMLSLPGSRWRQHNGYQIDTSLWNDKECHDQACAFWQQLALKLKNHPAIVGYNILNEPNPKTLNNCHRFSSASLDTWYESSKNTCADLNVLYRKVVDAIRTVDAKTPIILDTGLFASPWAIRYLEPLEHRAILYSFHMYEPYAYTTRQINGRQFSYSSTARFELEFEAPDCDFNKEYLKLLLQPVVEWQKKHNVSSSQIIVGEFGCDRTTRGAEKYLGDLIDIFNEHDWHWAFYSFQEDGWDSMDYELGPNTQPALYWTLRGGGKDLATLRHDNPLFDTLKREFGNRRKQEHRRACTGQIR